MRSIKSPGSNPIIKRVMAYATELVPELKDVQHQFCPKAETYHKKSSRVFAHTHCTDDGFMICWCHAMRSLSAMNLAGICVHELGHVLTGRMPGASEFDRERAADIAAYRRLGLEVCYVGKNNLQALDLKSLEE